MTEDTILKIPEPTEEERIIAERLIKSGNRDIQKPHGLFEVAATRVAEIIYQDREEKCKRTGDDYYLSIRENSHIFTTTIHEAPYQDVEDRNDQSTWFRLAEEQATANGKIIIKRLCNEWKSFILCLAQEKTAPAGEGITELLQNVIGKYGCSENEKRAYKVLYHILSSPDKYVPTWSQETAEKLFADLKAAQVEGIGNVKWHLCCMDVYEYFCLKHHLVFYHFTKLYYVTKTEPFDPEAIIPEVSNRFTAYALRYPSAFTETFERILEVVKNYSRSICDTQPFTVEDPWVEKRLQRVGHAALLIQRHGTLQDFKLQRDVFCLFDDDLVQDGEKLRDEAGESVIFALCKEFGVKADPHVNPWKWSHLYASWSMDDEFYNRPIYEAERMSTLVPFIDAIGPRKLADCRAELIEYYRKVYPSMGCDDVEVDLNEAVEGITAIAQKYLPPKPAAAFIRSVLDTIIRDCSPGQNILEAILERCRTYTNRMFLTAADTEKTDTIYNTFVRYLPDCRAEQKLESRIRAHVLQQEAIHQFTGDSLAAYHLLTEQNASDIFSEAEVHAMPGSKRFVKVRLYDTLCALDHMTPYLVGKPPVNNPALALLFGTESDEGEE